MNGKTLIKLYPKQEELIRAMVNNKRVIALSCRQSGKCLIGQTFLTIKNKKTGKIENITIEDFFNKFNK